MVIKTGSSGRQIFHEIAEKSGNPKKVVPASRARAVFEDSSQCSNGYYDCMQKAESFYMDDSERLDYFKRYILFNTL